MWRSWRREGLGDMELVKAWSLEVLKTWRCWRRESGEDVEVLET